MDAVTPAEDRYLSLKALADYSGLSIKTLSRYLASATRPLPHFKLGNRILVRQSDFDRWIEDVATPDHVAKARTYDAKVQAAVRGVTGRR